MADDASLAEILARQSPCGGFPSTVGESAQATADENCFITALVAIALCDGGLESSGALRRAADFIERCEDPGQPGAFRFHPYEGTSPRLAISLVPDADDTALAWLVLVRSGRRSAKMARRAVAQVLEPHRLDCLLGREPPWVRPGAMRTWLRSRARDNPVDLCVNANVAALYATLALRSSPTYRAICETIAGGVRTTLGAAAFQRSLAPYYAHPLELLHALTRAAAAGAVELSGPLETLRAQGWARDHERAPWPGDQPICCNDHGRPLWRAPVLQMVRRWATARGRAAVETDPRSKPMRMKEALSCT